VTRREYLIVALPRFEVPSSSPKPSDALQALNDVGVRGWEAVGMTVLDDPQFAVLFKRHSVRGSSEATNDTL